MHALLWAAVAFAILPLAVGLPAVACCAGRVRRGRLKGLLFHSIPTSRRSGLSFYAPERFEALAALVESMNLRTLTVREAATGVLPEPSVVLSFDDGFLDFYDNALPVLSRHNLKATLFPVAAFVGKQSSWDIFPALPHINEAQLREIAGRGFEVGSHTLSHVDLTLLDDDRLVKELRDSKRILEDITGVEVTSLSFPCGRWNRRVWDCAQSLGYTSATAYTRASSIPAGLIPLTAAYAFDSPADLLARIGLDGASPVSRARGWIMPHFAKGTPVWSWRPYYRFR